MRKKEDESKRKKLEEERIRQLEERQKKQHLDNLLVGLHITTNTKDILVKHEIVTAAALTMIGVDKLEQLGIKIGQVLEIKGRFNENGTRPSALQQSTIGAAVCVFDLIYFLYLS